MRFIGTTNELLELRELGPADAALLAAPFPNGLRIIWNTGDELALRVDGQALRMERDQLLFLTEHHRVEPERIAACRFVRFNRPFFCVIERDSEVGCKGILFFGASELPVLTIGPADKEKFDILWRMFTLEMHSSDSMQKEMLHMMLRRLLILCTRLYKVQRRFNALVDQEVEVVREFFFLVETHFRTLHAVVDYAKLLHRSPKTLANLFARSGKRPPLKHIQERVMVEARRLIRYSDRPMKDISQELGFEDVQTFSRFFKTQEGTSPTEFRTSGSIANTSGSPVYQAP